MLIAAIAIIWFSLLIRKSLILLTVVLAPLALSGASWDATKGWIGKWATFLIALIVSKLVMVVVFLVAITQLATPIELDISAVTEPISGVVLLGIAAFAPYMVYRLLSFIGFDLYNSIGTEQDAKNAMNRPVPLPTKPPKGDSTKKVLDNDSSGDGGKGPGKGSPPATKPGSPTPPTGGGSPPTGGGGTPGPVPVVVATAEVQVAKDTAEAGPKAGEELGQHTEQAADHAGNNGGGSSPNPPPPSPPVPKTPPSGKD